MKEDTIYLNILTMEDSKFEVRGSKQSRNIRDEILNKYKRLEERTEQFARNVRILVASLPKSTANFEDGKQLIRASGSIGANYIEANEALGKKDFQFHIKISKKEAKECCFWLRLLTISNNSTFELERARLLQEATELMNIFGAILRNSH